MMETAEGSVYNVLSSLGRVSDKDLIDHMIEAFSDIPTQEDAIDKLRTLRRKDEALIAFNATNTAIHHRAYDCEPVNQVRESVWREYANTLDRDFASSLNYQIGRQKGIHLHTLEDVMEKAKDMEIQERKNKAYKDRKDLATMAATTEATTPVIIKEYKTRTVLPRDTTKAGDTSINTGTPEVTPKMISNLNL